MDLLFKTAYLIQQARQLNFTRNNFLAETLASVLTKRLLFIQTKCILLYN